MSDSDHKHLYDFWAWWRTADMGDEFTANHVNKLVFEKAGGTIKSLDHLPYQTWSVTMPDGRNTIVRNNMNPFDLIPRYMQSFDAALSLPLPEGCHSVLVAPCPPDKTFRAWLGRRNPSENYFECTGHSSAAVHVGAWWAVVVGEPDAG